jgi:hypothetical protein
MTETAKDLTQVATSVRNARTVLTLTDGGREPAYDESLDVAISLARALGARLLLIDRSAETWADTPHAVGPMSAEEARRLRGPHIREALDLAEAAGLDVTVWAWTLPLPESYDDAVERNHVDVSVLPERFQRPTLLERLMGTRVARVAKEIVPRVPIVEVGPRGSLIVL